MKPRRNVHVSRATAVNANVVGPWRQKSRSLQFGVEASGGGEATSQVACGIVPQHPVPSSAAKAGMAAVLVAHVVATRAEMLSLVDRHQKPALHLRHELLRLEKESELLVRHRLEEGGCARQQLGLYIRSVGYSQVSQEGAVMVLVQGGGELFLQLLRGSV